MTTQRDRTVGATTQLATEVSINFGSSIAGLLIPIVGSVVVVAVRQLVTALVVVPLSRPRIRGRSWRALWPAIALGVILAVMNLTFYEAVGRVGLGIAATIEFLGPLSIALATSRRILDVVCALAAGAGVFILAGGEGQLDVVGILLALAAGVSWALYILVTRTVAARFKGLEGLGIASVVALAIIGPAALVVVDYSAIDWRVLGLLVATGILCSAIPYSLDSVILRRITPRLYSIITSCSPVIAALFGWLILGQGLSLLQQLAVVLVCAAAATAFATQRTPPASQLEATATVTP
ncbi:MAG TPA: EamA family transporter [Terrimesophilobacter sp.]|nr:EamA family transporter [Terrimesophilobacter sp.]